LVVNRRQGDSKNDENITHLTEPLGKGQRGKTTEKKKSSR